jgi:hypothetical protein
VPARGYVFDFRVYLSLTWTSNGLHLDELDAWSQQFNQRARRDLGRIAADLSRAYPAHRPSKFEAELNRRLVDAPFTYERSGVALTCRAVAWVRLDPRVKEYLLPYWEKRIKMEAEHDVGLRRAELVDQRNQRWLALLEKVRNDPAAEAAARLTEQEFAEVMREMLAERKAALVQLKELSGQSPSGFGGGGFGLYEFDRLAEALGQRAGLPTNGHPTNGS